MLTTDLADIGRGQPNAVAVAIASTLVASAGPPRDASSVQELFFAGQTIYRCACFRVSFFRQTRHGRTRAMSASGLFGC